MNLYFIGPRGSGKSTVAEIVARRMGLPLIETDAWIQTQSGRSIAQLFAEQGEARFREWESAALVEAARCPAAVVDLGGGAILDPTNRQQIQQSGLAVWLFAAAEELSRRIADDPRSMGTRPALTVQGGLDEVRQILAARESIYAACADYEIDTGRLSADEVARRVAAWYGTVDKRNSGRRESV